LVVFTPKSLLRHAKCISPKSDFTKGGFKELIDDEDVTVSKVKRVLFCSGKLYYDLLEHKEENKRKDVAIVRIEQLYPMPEKQMDKIIKKYKKADYFWVQEEPKNMGAWTYMLRRESNQALNLISRKASASPATGHSAVHKREQDEIIQKAFDTGKK
jgi:2-oxoglutarate dehydrogenase E1 component